MSLHFTLLCQLAFKLQKLLCKKVSDTAVWRESCTLSSCVTLSSLLFIFCTFNGRENKDKFLKHWKNNLTVSVNMNMGPSCVFAGLEDTYSFDSCLLRSERGSEREEERGTDSERNPTLLNTRLSSSGSQTSFSNLSFSPLPKTCFLLCLSSPALIRPLPL